MSSFHPVPRRPQKTRGQARPQKLVILSLLESGPMTCAEMGKIMGIDSHTVRNHITTLVRNAEAFKVPDTAPAKFCINPEDGRCPAEVIDEDQPRHIHRPVGTWEHEPHRPAFVAVSVFELGVAV